MPSTAADRLQGVTTSVAVKAPCKVVSITNLVLSGLQTVNGVVLAEGDRVLVAAQNDHTKNGIYDASSGVWTRALDFNGNRDVVNGTVCIVVNTVGAATGLYRTTCVDPVVFDTTGFTFTAIGTRTFGISIRDYGAVCDGVHDDTAAVNAAIAAAGTGTTVYYDGAVLISSTITITKKIEFYGLGGLGILYNDLPASYLLKAASMTTSGIVTQASGVILHGGGVVAANGASGHGIVISGNHNQSYFVTSTYINAATGGIGGANRAWWIGDPTNSGRQADGWLMMGCRGTNYAYGVYADPGGGGTNYGGVMMDCVFNNCVSGISFQSTTNASIISCSSVLNSVYGVQINGGCQDTYIAGGIRTGNGVGSIILVVGSQRTTIGGGINPTEVTDQSAIGLTTCSTVRQDRAIQCQGAFTPALAGGTTPGTQTYAGAVGYWQRMGDAVHIQISITLSAKDGATAGAMRITGVPFTYPGAFTSGIIGVAVVGWGGFTLPANYTVLNAGLQAGNNYIELTRSGSAQALANVDASEVGAAARFYLSMVIPINKF